MATYSMITGNEQLAQVCEGLQHEAELAVDLEADSLHHYREKVCLVQISNRSDTWLVDPLQVTDFSPLAVLLERPSLLTVFHGGDYDVRSLHRDFGISVATMYDTMIAAQFVGINDFGLAALLRGHFNIELDKRFQKADWSKRPLTPEMADYAADDTAHLLGLADQLRQRVQEAGRTEWVAEECALIAGNRMADKGDGPLFQHCKGVGRLQRRNLAVLEELLQFRDGQARELDRPPFKVIPADSLIQIAERIPASVQEMSTIVGLTSRLLDRYGNQLLAAVKRGAAVPAQQLPRIIRSKGEPNPGIKARVALLKQWRERQSRELALTTGVVAPNWLLERIAEQQPETFAELAAVPGIRRWQTVQWGDAVLALLRDNRSAV